MRFASAKANSTTTPSTPSFYEWKVEGHPLSIHMSLEVMDRLGDDIMKGFWAVPKRGAEVGGILIGRVVHNDTSLTVYIDDYEPVVCEYRRGPSYVLSEQDRRRLEKALRKASPEAQVVGFFRSHTRLGLYLDQDDFSLIQSYFANPKYVFLLVRPHASKIPAAGFFFWEEGTIHRQATYLEFPFSRAEILKRSGIVVEPEAAPESPRVRFSPLETEPQSPRWRTLRIPVPRIPRIPRWRPPVLNWRKLGVAALALLAFALLEYLVVRALTREPQQVSADASPALRVEHNGRYLQVNWNRQAPLVLHASRGVLAIIDGVYQKEIELDANQLRTGSVAYAPSSSDVSFRLDLLGSRRTVSESLRVVGFPAAPPSVQAAVPPAASPVQSPPPPEARPVPVVSHPGTRPEHRPGTVLRAQKPRPASRRGWYDDGL